MDRKWLVWAGIHGFLAVACGAFAAHALKSRLEPELLELVDKGARYQLAGALSLLAGACLSPRLGLNILVCFALGTALFSGSLYAYAFSGVRAFGAVAPVGGSLLLLGWFLIFLNGLRKA
ncbi:MAG: DUF423 domain-containing protein [candidate division FCPU426 bacterium]